MTASPWSFYNRWPSHGRKGVDTTASGHKFYE